MKKCYFLLISLLLSVGLRAQQEDQFTQFMYYKLGFNPAFAGSDDGACLSALVRSQWVGLEGAPQSQLLTFNMPVLNQRVGVGASLLRQTIGVSENYTFEGSYAYRVPLGRGFLAAGLQASVRLLRVNFNELSGTQPIETDAAIPAGIQSKYVPNFGAGLYYDGQRFYLGLSVPRLLENNIDLADSGDVISREVRHAYLMGGLILPLGDKVQFLPQLLLKYVNGAPFDGDVNLSLVLANRFTVGASYRLGGPKESSLGESVSALLGVQISDTIFFGVSYDATLTELRKYNSGTLEGALRYCIGGRPDEEEFVNPRFF